MVNLILSVFYEKYFLFESGLKKRRLLFENHKLICIYGVRYYSKSLEIIANTMVKRFYND